MGGTSKKRSKAGDEKSDKEKQRGEHSTKHERVSTKNERKRKKDEDTTMLAVDDVLPSKKRRNQTSESAGEQDDGESASGGGGEISLSIEETNKLREKLGLAPLQMDDDKPKSIETVGEDGKVTTESVYKVDGVEFVHKPAENWADKKSAEAVKEKLAAHKEKRKIQEKLNKLKALGEVNDDEANSAAAWVAKSRKLEEERALAQQRAKMLEDMDKEFGVGDIVEENVAKKRPKNYSEKNLKGLTVQHSVDAFLQGRETILVLQDKDVLDESEEVLINPTLVEEERWKQNVELRKKKPGYNPYEEEIDDFGNLKEKKLLGKYDEVIDGDKKESFKLGARGSVDGSYEKLAAERMRAQLRENAETLDMKPAQLASEYYTADEMVKFKKPKKRVKKLRRPVTVDDLQVDATNEDYGSRARGKGRKKEKYEEGMETNAEEAKEEENPKFKLKKQKLQEINEDNAVKNEDEYDDLSGFVVEDDADHEFQAVLHRTRLLKQSEQKLVSNSLSAEQITQLGTSSRVKEEEPDQVADDKGAIVLNTISEYCRGLGDIPTYGQSGNRNDAEEMFDEEEEEPMEEEAEDKVDVVYRKSTSEKHLKKQRKTGKWVETEFDEQDRMSSVSSSDSSEEDNGEFKLRPAILEDEPTASSGVAAALKLARKKGYLERGDDGDHGPSKLAHLEAQRFTIVDKQFHDIDDKYAKKLERMGGYSGPTQDFKEKSTYVPNIKLEYSDEKGHLMGAKEAFRFMSWKFHGKNPGKRKVEKRTKKFLESQLMNSMPANDTPLGTLGKQIEKQKSLQTPYIVLSGAGSKDANTSIKKD